MPEHEKVSVVVFGRLSRPSRTPDELIAASQALSRKVDGILDRLKAEDGPTWRRRAQAATTPEALDEILRGYMQSYRVGYGEAYQRLVEHVGARV